VATPHDLYRIMRNINVCTESELLKSMYPSFFAVRWVFRDPVTDISYHGGICRAPKLKPDPVPTSCLSTSHLVSSRLAEEQDRCLRGLFKAIPYVVECVSTGELVRSELCTD
jgi:hypothetical protein